MTGELLEIQPEELKFIFEPEKKVSCFIRLTNKSDHHVAFKVFTTTPKMYGSTPVKGVIKPKSSQDVEVTRQASGPSIPLPDVLSKEKLFFQCTIVPPWTIDEYVTLNTFSKDVTNNKHVEEKMLNVIFIKPTVEEEMRLKVKDLELRLRQANGDILKLKEERKIADQEKIILREQLEVLMRSKKRDSEAKKNTPFVSFKCFNLKLV